MDLRRGLAAAVVAGAALHAAPALAAPPANDNFASRQALSGTALSVPGTTVEATTEPGDPTFSRTVWYSWTPPQDMVVQLDTCTSGSKFVTDIWSGATLSSLKELNTRDDEPFPVGCPAGPPFYDLHLYDVTGGTTYAISVYESFVGQDGPFTLNLSTTPRPPNDDFAAAQDLGQALDVDVDGTTAGARPESGEPGYDGRGNSVWYRWTAPKRTRVWIDNCNAETESSRVGVYVGGSLGGLTQPGGGSGTPQPQPAECEGNGRRFEFLATAGTTYMIQVATARRDHGAFHLRMRGIRFDASLHQTASATRIKQGKTVTYTIDVENVGTLDIDSTVGMVTSKPNHLTKPVKETKYLSIEATKGKCKPEMMLANPHPGARCDIKLAPGESTRITAKVKPDQSLSHWAALGFVDDNLDNEDDKPVNVTVKPKRRRR